MVLNKPIPQVALLKVFADVWAQYTALLEQMESNISVESHHFMIDVEAQLHRIYGNGHTFSRIHQTLLDNPTTKTLRASRSALGEAFLLNELWPAKNYFNGRN